MIESSRHRRMPAQAWLQLFRAPNLLTVPGDPIAGLLLAAAAGRLPMPLDLRMLWCSLASLMLYGGGLLTNDLLDLAEDRLARSSRPLPAGEASPKVVAIVAAVLMLAGVASAVGAGFRTAAVAAVLAGAVLLYNSIAKRVPVVGPLNMGACRALSLLLGASAVGTPAMFSGPALLCAAGLGLYIAAVTQLARYETQAMSLGLVRFLPAEVLTAWFAAVWWVFPPSGNHMGQVVVAAFMVLLVGRCLMEASPLKTGAEPGKVQRAVGGMIGLLIYIQAMLVLVVQSRTASKPLLAVVLALVAASLVHTYLARRFYRS